MKTFHFNFNDWCSVTLTEAGAKHISAKRKAFYDTYPQCRRSSKDFPAPKEVFTEGEVYRAQFWSLIQDFNEMMSLGMESPFLMGDIKVESSLES